MNFHGIDAFPKIASMNAKRLVLPLGLATVCLLALVIRLWGIAFGLPFTYHPDEPQHVLQALAIAHRLPQGLTFHNPPLYKYLLLGEYILTFVIGHIAGTFASPHDFVNQFRADPTRVYLVARITSAVLGTALVAVVYRLGVKLLRRRVGFVAAIFTAVTYSLVRESHFAVNDALVTLLTTVELYATLCVLERGTRREYLVAGALAGLAFSAKYQGAVVLTPLVVAHFFRAQRRWRDLFLALGAAIVTVVISFPSLWLETNRVLHDIYLNLYQGQTTGYDGLDPVGGYGFYAKALGVGLGLPLLVSACIGMGLTLQRRERTWLVLASFPIALYLVLGYEKMYFARYILPAVPPLILFAARALDDFLSRLQQALGRDTVLGTTMLGVVLVLGLAAPPLLNSLRFDLISTRTDTRTLARDWIESHLPRGVKIASDWYPFAPALDPKHYDLLLANGWALYDLTPDDYRQRGVEYLVTTSFIYDQWVRDGERDARRTLFYNQLAREAQLIAEIRPTRGTETLAFVYDQLYAPYDQLEKIERPGPTVRVYHILSHAASR